MYDASIDRVSIGIGKRNVHSCSFVLGLFIHNSAEVRFVRFICPPKESE